MKVLLSPAKNIDLSNTLQTNEYTAPLFLEEAESLVKKLRKFSSKKLRSMMHISNDLAELNAQRFDEWEANAEPNQMNAHAVAAFNGEVYRGLNAESMTVAELKSAQDCIRILSGLYGILKPLDIIYPYRLEMGTSWAITPKKKNLYQYWGSKITDVLNAEESDVIVNVASNEYFKVIDKKKLKARVITPIFKDFKNGEYKTIMVYAKNARGAMARFIVRNNITDPEQIKLFDSDGYQYDDNLSGEDEWVFTR